MDVATGDETRRGEIENMINRGDEVGHGMAQK